MTNDYTTEVNEIASAMNAVYENKQVNKKDNISGDFSTDTASYPTVKAVKNLLANDYITENEINTLLSSKVNVSDIKDNLTSTDNNKPLSAKQGKELKNLIDNIDLTSTTLTIEKTTTNIGDNIARYTIKQGGTPVTNGVIDIPKDFLVKSAELKTCSTANSPVNGYVIGDKYIDFVINTKDNSSTAEHMYVLVSDLVDNVSYSADGTTLQLTNNQFSIKNGGVGENQISDSVKNTWLDESDVQEEISAFANALSEAINPSS